MDYSKIIVIGASREDILKSIAEIKDWAGTSGMDKMVYVAVDEFDKGQLMKLADIEEAVKSDIPEWLKQFSDQMNESVKRRTELAKLTDDMIYIKVDNRESSGRVTPREQRNRERFMRRR